MINNKQGKLFRTFMLTYIVLLLIPIFFMGYVSYRANIQLEKELTESNRIMMKQVQETIDTHIKIGRSVTNEIILNSDVINYLNTDQPEMDLRLRTAVMNVINHMNTVAVLHNTNLQQVDNIYMYSKTHDSITDFSSHYRTDVYFDYVGKYSFEESFWKESILNTEMRENLLLLPDNRRNRIFYTYTLRSRDSLKGTIVIEFDADNILGLLESITGIDKCNIYILDNSGKVIYGKTPNIIAAENIYDLVAAGMNNTDYITYEIKSEVCDWCYVSIVPRAVLLSESNYLTSLMIAFIVLSLLIGIGCALIFSRLNTKPINALTKLIKQNLSTSNFSQTDEISFLEKGIKQAFSERQHYFNTLEQQIPLLQKSYFNDHLRQGDFSRDELSALHIDFPDPYFIVLSISIEENDFVLSTLNNLFIKLYDFISSIGYHGYILDNLPDTITITLNFSKDKLSSSKDRALSLVQLIRQMVSAHEMIPVSAGIGTVKKGIDQIQASYMEACRALNFKIIYGLGQSIFFDELEIDRDEHYHYPLAQELKLINYIKAGDYENSSKMVTDLFEENLNNLNLTPDEANCFLFDFAGTIMKAMEELHITASDIVNIDYEPSERLLNSSSSQEMMQTALHLLQNICQYINANKPDTKNTLKNRIQEYIDQHFTDENLSMIQICEAVNISPSYLSRFFKEQVGENLKNYILRRRIEYAKKLLTDKENNYTIAEISKLIGCVNSNNFIRIFKRFEGITPGQYCKNTEMPEN